MRGTVRLGRIGGVPVSAHWSLLVILVLIADVLATGVLPATAEGASQLAYWLTGTFVALAFLASLLAHEVSHAIVARRRGMTVNGITLWMLGGVTALEEMPRDPSTDLRVAISGPLVSIGCGVASLAAAYGVHAIGASRVVTAGLVWLAITNGLLAVFNLLPGAPLDGGRVLRALVWRRTGDQARAEMLAARVGRMTGLTLVALGFVDALATADVVGGIWLMVVGWFLATAAAVEMRATTTERALGGLRVRDAMDVDLTWLPAYLSVTVAAGRALDGGADWCPVCDMQGAPVGVVMVDRLVNAAVQPRGSATVMDVMLPLGPRIIAGPDDPLAAAVLRSGPNLPVVAIDDGRIVGIVTPRQTARAVRRGRLSTAGSSV